MLHKGLVLGAAMAMTLGIASNARANLIQDPSITVSGSGLGAVSTIVTVHDSGGGSPGTNGTEGGCITQDGSTSASCTPLTDTASGTSFDVNTGVTEHDNLAVNNVLNVENTTTFAAVVNLSETGTDDSTTLTALYLEFCGINGCHVATLSGGPVTLLAGFGNTGTGGSGFVFTLDATEAAIVAGLGPTVTVSGGVQFANGTTNDGNETLYLIAGSGQPSTLVPEPASLTLFGLGLSSLGALVRRRKAAKSAA